ncbi:MAG: protein translocase subunit SecF, partial [Candidatus Moranbacteria bacterium]|nr:protein translocase subunit SecF [Candidatus Moranbacteria bacterium]
MYNILGKRKYFYVFSGTLMLLSIISLSTWGLRYGLDFTGGTLAEFSISNSQFSKDEIKSVLGEAGIN